MRVEADRGNGSCASVEHADTSFDNEISAPRERAVPGVQLLSREEIESPERLMLDLPRQLALAVQTFFGTGFTVSILCSIEVRFGGNCRRRISQKPLNFAFRVKRSPCHAGRVNQTAYGQPVQRGWTHT